jgi:hypothetical protein
MWLRERRHNLIEGLLEKSELAKHAYQEGRRVAWDEARTLEIESNSGYRKYKQSDHVACLTNPTSHPRLVISTIWISLFSNKFSNSQGKPI